MNDPSPTCDACQDKLFPRPGCSECAQLATEASSEHLETEFLDAQLTELAGDLGHVRVTDEGIAPLDKSDYVRRAWLLCQAVVQRNTPLEAMRLVQACREETGSAAFTAIVIEEAMEQIGRHLTEGVPLERLPKVMGNLLGAISVYRDVRPIAGGNRVALVRPANGGRDV